MKVPRSLAIVFLRSPELERTFAIHLGWEREENRIWNLNPWDVHFLWPIK